jgi:hypothetical protein
VAAIFSTVCRYLSQAAVGFWDGTGAPNASGLQQLENRCSADHSAITYLDTTSGSSFEVLDANWRFGAARYYWAFPAQSLNRIQQIVHARRQPWRQIQRNSGDLGPERWPNGKLRHDHLGNVPHDGPLTGRTYGNRRFIAFLVYRSASARRAI